MAIGLAVLVLAGCAPSSTDTKPTEAAPTPTPTQTTEPAGEERPPITSLTLTTEGLGELTLGEAPPSDDPASDLVSYDPQACAAEKPDDPGLWTANYADIDDGFGPMAPFAIGVRDDLLYRIDLNTTHILTDQGLSIGSSLDALLGAYPGGPDEVVNHADVSDVYVFLGTKGKLQFEVAVDRIPGYWDADALDTIVFLSAIDINEPAYGVAASSNAVGICNNS
jgi:hypothetical protein